MAITEESRHRLHQRLEKVLGEEPATTLMEHLPQRGWEEMATKRDLDQLQAAVGQVQAALKRDIDHLGEVMDVRFSQTASKQDLHNGLRSVVVTMVVTNLAFWGLALATLRTL